MTAGRILALDHGTVRIGVAVSDEESIGAHPREFIAAGKPDTIERIRNLAADLGVVRIVVGLPVGLDGSEGPAAAAARDFAGQVAEATGIATELVDERFTTVIAERALIGTGSRRGRRRQIRDSAAAAVLLQGYLEKR